MKVVSEMLGHAGVAITLQVYAQVLLHMQWQTADELDVALRALGC